MEFKDYYAILEIDRLASSEEIRTAYRSLSKKWHPDHNPGRNVMSKMQEINEAYAILKDPIKKARYDFEYDTFHSPKNTQQTKKNSYTYQSKNEVHDENLKKDINEAQKYAEDLVSEFFKSLRETSKVAAKGAWEEAKAYLIIGIIWAIIGTLILICCM